MSDSYLNNQKFFKPNYDEALYYIVPKYLIENDIKTFGKEIDLKDQIINSHINVAKDVTSIINVTGAPNSPFSSINTLSGFSQFFIKQNELSDITPESFEFYILNQVDKSYRDFATKEEFKSFLDTYLLPSIRLNNFTGFFQRDALASSTQISLIDNLSWLYFLNKQGPAPTYYSVSSSISQLIADKLYFGKTIYLNDCLKLLSEYLFRNNLSSYIPSVFVSSTGEFTSGTQQLDKLKTWIDVIYSPLYADRNDTTVLDRFNLYIENLVRVNEEVPKGPFSKFLKMLGFAAYDTNSNTQELESLYDIENCDKEYLPLLADLIGWRLFGSDPQKWRLQLRNAVDVYKSAGTKRSLQLAINTFFPKNAFALESRIEEVWESYVPFLIYYALATESDYFKTNESWTKELSLKMNVPTYSYSSVDENIKLATDRVIYEVYSNFKQNFKIPNIENKFYFRGIESEIPPFEEYPYYANTELEHDMIDVIVDRLVCFGVNREFASGLGEYIRTNTLGTVLEPRVGGWLFFTSGYQPPTNLSKLVLNPNSKKFEYTPLWSGKSSHFVVNFNANDFNFVDTDISSDSGNAVAYTSEVINQFTPTHAIPLVHMNISGADEISFNSTYAIAAKSDKVDPCEYYTNSNYQASALYVSGYKRNTGTGKIYGRPSLQNLQSDLLKTAVSINSVPRNSVRRRSYEKIMPFNGYYDRTGFNMPISFDYSFSAARLPLGFIPSSLTFQGISDYRDIPEVYSKCNNIDSNASYYGYYVSNTIACRGGKELAPEKNLVILAGQSNMNGRGQAARSTVTNINYWDLDASAFVNSLVPFQNTQTNVPFNSSSYGHSTSFWGPELRFAELLSSGNRKDTYLFKFAQDNSLVVDAPSKNTWCPSSTQGAFSIYSRFNSALNLAIDALGGALNLKTVTLIWSQGETEAGTGQLNDASALAFSAATQYFLDTVRDKFPSFVNFNIIRAKINNLFGSGSQADYKYYPNGQQVPDATLLAAGLGVFFSSVSSPGFYGDWSWSSTQTVRQAQENLDQNVYGQLLNFDDLSGFKTEPNFDGSAPSFPPLVLPVGPGTVSVYASGQSYINSSIHYDDSSIDEIGERFYAAWDALVGGKVPSASRGFRVDRSQLPEVYAVMHRIGEARKYFEASASISASLFNLRTNYVYQSFANSATENANWFPSSASDYYNFKFGRDFHKLYNVYTKEFNRHNTSRNIQETDGPNIFSHTFGPLLYNHDFDKVNGSYIVSSFSSTDTINNSNILSIPGSYTASATSSLSFSPYKSEFINSSIISSIDIISVSGTPLENSFAVVKVPFSQKQRDTSNYMYERTFIKMRSLTNLPRIRININNTLTEYTNSSLSSVYPNPNNFLLPEHDYRINVKGLICSNDGLTLGGRSVGVWIHTKPENGDVWSYSLNGEWIKHDNTITREELESKFFFTKSYETIDRTASGFPDNIKKLKCVDIITSRAYSVIPLLTLDESDFGDFIINFNTMNKYALTEANYHRSYGQVHRKNQNYVIEVFLLPDFQSGFDNFFLLDKVDVMDVTLNEMSKIFARENVCPTQKLNISREEVGHIFKFWNDISGKNSLIGYASRDSAETSTYMHSQGGSRLDYRVASTWLTRTYSGSRLTELEVPV